MLASIAVQAEPISNGRTELQVAELLAGLTPSNPWRMDAFAPAAGVASTAGEGRVFGRLVLRAGSQPAGFRVLQDTYGAADAPSAPVRRLPSPGRVDLVQDGNALIPQTRIPIAGSHPYWEFAFGVGRTWQEPGDGEWTRAALPFSLMEVNANCLHHGVLTFVFAPARRISHVAYQVSSETCAYFKADLWGFLQAELLDVTLPDAGRVVDARRTEVGGRLPRRPLAQLAVDHPGSTPAEFGHPAEVTPSQMSTWGVIVDGVHYSGGCPTRAGEYPFCDELMLPSYSVAKSVFGSLGLMRLERRFPGTRDQKVVDYVPECAAHGGWSGVTFENLLDMSSGHWTSAAAHADEDSVAMSKEFFDATPACRQDCLRLWPFSPARDGGSDIRVSHQRYLRAGYRACGFRATENGAAGRSARRRRLAGRLARRRTQSRGSTSRGAPATMHDSPSSATAWRCCRMTSPSSGSGSIPSARRHGICSTSACCDPHCSSTRPIAVLRRMWTVRCCTTMASGPRASMTCRGATCRCSCPSCRAFGGISIVLLPNGVTYYYFSDGNEFRFRRAIYAAAQLHPYCRTATASPAVMPEDPAS